MRLLKKSESQRITEKGNEYDLSDFTQEKTVAKTSTTLIRLISKLVSNGKMTRKSMSIAQSIQSQFTNIPNQTSLGLVIKLHHAFGSRYLIDTLHEHGVYCFI